MDEASRVRRDGRLALMHVTLPVVLLFIVMALLAGLVFGGVLQGSAEREGPAGPTTTRSTILIEP